jgi:hypothetical protein
MTTPVPGQGEAVSSIIDDILMFCQPVLSHILDGGESWTHIFDEMLVCREKPKKLNSF